MAYIHDHILINPTAGIKTTAVLATASGELRELFGAESADAPVETLYREVDIFRAGVKLRAQAVSQVPFSIYKNGVDEPVFNSYSTGLPPLDIRGLTYIKDIIRRTEESIILTGAGYWKKVFVGNKLIDLEYLPTTSTTTYINNGAVTEVVYRPQAGQGVGETIKSDQLFYVFDNDPYYRIGSAGLGDANTAVRPASTKRSLEQFATNFLGRGAVRATMIKVPRSTNADEKRRLKSWFQRVFGGAGNAGTVEAVSSDVSFETVGDGIDDLKFQEITIENKHNIAIALRIPPSILLSNASNYAEAQQQGLNFAMYTIIPQAELISTAINIHLLEPLGYRMVIEPHKMGVMQYAELEQAKALYTLVGQPLITREEARDTLGYTPEPELGVFRDTQLLPQLLKSKLSSYDDVIKTLSDKYNDY